MTDKPKLDLRYSEITPSMLYVLKVEAALGNQQAKNIVGGWEAWRVKSWRQTNADTTGRQLSPGSTQTA
jgi:hypothetical protein